MHALTRLRTYLDRLPTVTPYTVLFTGAALVCALITVGVGPWSPTALDQVEAALARGDVTAALSTCEQVARFGITDTQRDRARYRAALVRSALPGEKAGTIKLLRTLLRDGVHDPQLEALALTLLAQTLESQGQHLRAARRYEQIARLTPESTPWLQSASLAWERVGRTDRALLRQAQVAIGGSDQVAEARLAMGRLSLGQGRTDRAYAHYAAALRADPTHEQARLARLGMAMALDAMGRFDLAIAELDEAAHGHDHDHDRAIGITRERVARRAIEEQSTP